MKKKTKKPSFFKKKILLPVLKKYVEIVEKHRAKKAQKALKAKGKKTGSNTVTATSRQSINPYYAQNDNPAAKNPKSAGKLKNKLMAKRPGIIIPQRERKERIEKFKKFCTKYALRIAAVAFAVLFVFFCGYKYHSTMKASDVEESAKQFIEGKDKGKGYPYTINSVDVMDMQAMGSNLAVLTQENFLILSGAAKEEVRFLHEYSDPAMYTYSSRALIYDRATGKYCVLNSSKILLQGDLKTEIYSAVMSEDGMLAFSVKADSSPSKLVVISPRGKEVYSYSTENEKIFDMAVAPNSKGAALIVTGAKNAKLYSKLLVIDFKSDKPVKEFKYDDVLFDVIYPSSNRIITVGKHVRSTIKNSKERLDDYKYPEASLDFYDKADSGRTAIVLSEHGSEGAHKIVQFDSRSKLKSETVFNEKIHAISCSNKYVSVLLEDRAVLLDSKGRIKKEFKTNKNGKKIVNIGNDIYILYSSNIAKNS